MHLSMGSDYMSQRLCVKKWYLCWMMYIILALQSDYNDHLYSWLFCKYPHQHEKPYDSNSARTGNLGNEQNYQVPQPVCLRASRSTRSPCFSPCLSLCFCLRVSQYNFVDWWTYSFTFQIFSPSFGRSHFNFFVLSINIFNLNEWVITTFHTKETCVHSAGPMSGHAVGHADYQHMDTVNETAFSKYSLWSFYSMVGHWSLVKYRDIKIKMGAEDIAQWKKWTGSVLSISLGSMLFECACMLAHVCM